MRSGDFIFPNVSYVLRVAKTQPLSTSVEEKLGNRILHEKKKKYLLLFYQAKEATAG